MTKYCFVFMCDSKGNIPEISYHRLGKKRSDKWLEAIGKSSEDVNCENDAVPTLFLPRNVRFYNASSSEPPAKKLTVTSSNKEEFSKTEITSSSDSASLKGSPKRNRKLIKKLHTYA